MEGLDRWSAAGGDRRTDGRACSALPGGRCRHRRGRWRHRQPSRSDRPDQGLGRRDARAIMTERYARQVVLPEVGAAGQERFSAASALVVGAGGLGCPVLPYLAGVGVGRLIVVDHDRVEETNLHRQPLYTMADIGALKAQACRAILQRFNPGVEVEAVPERLTPQNASALVARADLVVDAADSFAVSYILSDACVAAAKPLVSASVIGMTGYAGAFCGGAPSYRAVFPDVSVDGGTCASVGVLGTAVAVLGSLQAHLALHLLLGLEPSALGRVVTFDAKRLAFGGFGFAGSPEPEPDALVPFIAPDAVRQDDIVVDLRSLAEAPVSQFPGARRLDVESVEVLADERPARRVVLCCRSGQRSLMAADRLRERGVTNLALVAFG